MTATKTTMVASLKGGKTVERIREPNPQDVLSGRGGGINSHKGNKAFREWVNQRKEEYNLAENKKEKIAVAMQVVRQVQQQRPVPGRFLQRDPTVDVLGSSGHWWVEIDEAKALAKTTQALREGAPKIRQAHGGAKKTTVKSNKRKRKAATLVAKATETPHLDDATEKLVLQAVKQDSTSLPRYQSEQLLLPSADYSMAIQQLQENAKKAEQDASNISHQKQPIQGQATSPLPTLLAPLTSNKTFNQMYGQQANITNKNSQFDPLKMPAVDPFAETPPLMAAPEPDTTDEIPLLNLDSGKTFFVDNVQNNSVPPPHPKRQRMHRVHSLALSEFDGTNLDPATEDLAEFVNPFDDESDVLMRENDLNVVKSYVPSAITNQWNKKNADAVVDSNGTTDQSRSKVISVGGYLNRLLSFSSASAATKDSNIDSCNVENQENSYNNDDYFFHDDGFLEGNVGGGMKSIFDVVHRDGVYPDNKNSSSSLTRRTSFASRNRGLVSGRQ